MDSPQSVVSLFKSSLVSEPENQNSGSVVHSSLYLSNGIEGIESGMVEPVGCELEDFIGVLEVYIHQARDIQNICIYHKQDVYAKLCLMSDPENTVSTKIINGGGRNPVFNDNVWLNVRSLDTSLKCEIYMMSRVKNYLEDQLLGLALIPLSEVLLKNGKLEKEFSLSSSDLFHSPAGFVQLSLSYTGASPEVIAIPVAAATNEAVNNPEAPESIPKQLDKIEFPDPNIVQEAHTMFSEYFRIPCTSMDSETSGSLVTCDANDLVSSKMDVNVVESFSNETVNSAKHNLKHDSPESSVSTNDISSSKASATSDSSDAPVASETTNPGHASLSVEKAKDAEGATSGKSVAKPVITVNVEPEKVVQQEIVDMYMKSMQQSLAQLKLPLDIDSPTRPENSSSDQKTQMPKTNGSRVFYGSRAFF